MFETLTTHDILAVLEQHTAGAWLFLPDKDELHWSPQMCQKLERRPHARTLEEVQALIHPDDQQLHLDNIHMAINEGHSELSFKTRVMHRDGHHLSFDFHATWLTTESGQRLLSGLATLTQDEPPTTSPIPGDAPEARSAHDAARAIDDMLAVIHERVGDAANEPSHEGRRDILLQVLQLTFQAREQCAGLMQNTKPKPDLAKRAALNEYIARSRAKLDAVNKFRSSGAIKSRGGRAQPDSTPTQRTIHTPDADDLMGISLLVVDDTPQIITVIKRLLKRLRVKVISARNANAALSRLEQGDIDVVLMDFAMPGMNGQIAALKMRALYPDLPIILNSGYSEDKAPPDWPYFLSKPFSFDELVTILQNARRDPLAASS